MYGTSVTPPLRLVFLMWLAYSIQVFTFTDLGFLGIEPFTARGLIGILTAPLIHGNIAHLLSNTFPVLFLGVTLYYVYPTIASRIFLQGYFFTNLLVWIFGRRDFYHIGASGLVYALAAFLISYGFFKGNFRSIVISVIMMMIYGGLIYGLFPQNTHVSWEAHLMGSIVGVGSAFGISKAGHKKTP